MSSQTNKPNLQDDTYLMYGHALLSILELKRNKRMIIRRLIDAHIADEAREASKTIILTEF